MPFFIELSWDEYGNRGYTNSKPRIIKADRTDEYTLTVIDPDISVFPWSTVGSRRWIECPGPAREVSYGEREAIIIQAQKENNQ